MSRSHPRALLRWVWGWICTTRRRKWVVIICGVLFGLFVFPGILGAVAMAQSSTATASGNSAMSFMKVHDSAGTDVSSYSIVLDDGGLLHPIKTGYALFNGAIFEGWLLIIDFVLWLPGYVMGFSWLNYIATPLRAMGKSFAGQLNTPIILMTATTIGAFFVAWFALRGYHAKMAMQIVVMLGAAVLGTLILADPLADVLSPDGWIAQGRDVAIEFDAGLMGNSDPQPTKLVATMQEEMADGLGSDTVQVWNFGHTLSGACKAGWEAGEQSGDDGQVKAAIQACGDVAAYKSIQNPSAGKIGTGLLFLIAAIPQLIFSGMFSVRIIWSVLDSIYHALIAVVCLTFGVYIYGPTQTATVRNLVHSGFAVGRMVAEVVFLGGYEILETSLLRQAQGQVSAVAILSGIFTMVAILQSSKLSRGLNSGSDWISNRVALAIQNGAAKTNGSGGGGGGGTAVGMGSVGASRHGVGVLATLAAASAFDNSPVTEWAFNRRTPLRRFSKQEKATSISQYGVWGAPGIGGPNGFYVQSMMNRELFSNAARRGAGRDGIDTVEGASRAIRSAVDVGAGAPDLHGALIGAGFRDGKVIHAAIRSWGIVTDDAKGYQVTDAHLKFVAAAMNRVVNSTNRRTRSATKAEAGLASHENVAADLATLEAAAHGFRRAHQGGVTLDNGRKGNQLKWVNAYMKDQNEDRLRVLGALASGDDLERYAVKKQGVWVPAKRTAGSPTPVHNEQQLMADMRNDGIDQNAAKRMWTWIGNEHAKRVRVSVTDLMADPTNAERMRRARDEVSKAQSTDQWAAPMNMPSPWALLAPPGPVSSATRDYPDWMSDVADTLHRPRPGWRPWTRRGWRQ